MVGVILFIKGVFKRNAWYGSDTAIHVESTPSLSSRQDKLPGKRDDGLDEVRSRVSHGEDYRRLCRNGWWSTTPIQVIVADVRVSLVILRKQFLQNAGCTIACVIFSNLKIDPRREATFPVASYTTVINKSALNRLMLHHSLLRRYDLMFDISDTYDRGKCVNTFRNKNENILQKNKCNV